MSRKKELLDKIMFAVTDEIDLLSYKADAERYNYEVDNIMRQRLAQHLIEAKIDTKINDFYVKKTLKVYVATSDEFWELANIMAREITRYSGGLKGENNGDIK